tara:strand:+ start:1456 stop:1998 length:543 start_codon:yes stop_codon:yes gene_type:complete
MAKKKVKLPAYVLKQFDKAMYKVGDEVMIRWLGQIKTGYVTKYYKSNWGMAYTVEVTEPNLKKKYSSTRYPCGIQIKEYSTDYKVGLILHEQTQESWKPGSRRIHEDTRSTTVKVKTSSGSSRNNDNSNNRKTPGSGNNATSKASAKSSSKRVHDNNSKKRSLDTAIDRQRDFLNGFVKK